MVASLVANEIARVRFPLSAPSFALVVQLVETMDLGSMRCGFESCQGHQFRQNSSVGRAFASYANGRRFKSYF